MIQHPNPATIANMTDVELRAAYAHIMNTLNGEHSVEEQAMLLHLLQRIRTALRMSTPDIRL